jgi:hypothetical protein
LRRLLPRLTHVDAAPILLICALIASLAFAATASAETRAGEITAPVDSSISPEGDIVKATASYDPTAGSLVFNITTAAEPRAKDDEGTASNWELSALLGSTFGACNDIQSVLSPESVPLVELVAPYAEGAASFVVIESFTEERLVAGAGMKSTAGVTTTLSATSRYLVNRPFNCAAVGTVGSNGEQLEEHFVTFPLVALPEPPTPTPVPTLQTASPGPAPATLSIAKAKPMKLKIGKSRTLKIKVTNTGGTTTATGSLRAKPPKGVTVKPETQKIPMLAPGASWNLSFRVEMTTKAKEKSMISLTGTAPGLSSKSSFVVKLAG